MSEPLSIHELYLNLHYLFDWNHAFLMSGLGICDVPVSPDEMKQLRECCAVLTSAVPEMFSVDPEASDQELIAQIVDFFKTHGT